MIALDERARLAAIRTIAGQHTADQLERILAGCSPEIAEGVREHLRRYPPTPRSIADITRRGGRQ